MTPQPEEGTPTGQTPQTIETMFRDWMHQMSNNGHDKGSSADTVNQLISFQLLRQEFQLTSQAQKSMIEGLSADIKIFSKNYLQRTEFDTYKEFHDKQMEAYMSRNTEEFNHVYESIGKKADADVVDTRLERIEKVVWGTGAVAGGACVLALMNLILN